MTMSAGTALLALAWLAIAVLAFAMAGLLRQVRILEQLRRSPQMLPTALPQGRDLFGAAKDRPEWLDPVRLTALLFVSPGCSACRDVLREAKEIAALEEDAIVLRLVPTSGTIESESPGLHPLNNAAWLLTVFPTSVTPFLAIVDPKSRVLVSQQVGSAAAFSALIKTLARGTRGGTKQEVLA